MADIFLSYKSEDRALAQRVAQALEREGARVWWDRKIVAGGVWREAIAREIRQARVVIALWSRASEDVRAAAWMLNELDEAQRLGVPIIPVMLEPCEAPLGFRHVQAADLSDWRGEPNHPEWREVAASVRAALAGRRIHSATAPAVSKKPVKRRAKAGGGASVLMAALFAVAAWGAWHWVETHAGAAVEVADARPLEPPQTPPPQAEAEQAEAAPVEPERVEPTRYRDHARAHDRRAEMWRRAEAFPYQGEDGVRGVFRRTRGPVWVERNSETRGADYYRLARRDEGSIELHDERRDLWARIDLDAGEIAIKEAGAEAYEPRYRLIAGLEDETGRNP